MGMKVGLWIDHRKAVIVTLTDRGETIDTIQSGAERQLRRSGESPLRGPFDVLHVPADTVRQRAFTSRMNVFYDSIVTDIQAADAVLIMGPSEAREELKKRMQRNGLVRIIAGVEKAGRMTNRQIAAKVRRYFAV